MTDDWRKAEWNLHRCNCKDDKAHVDHRWHWFICDYRKWFVKAFGENFVLE